MAELNSAVAAALDAGLEYLAEHQYPNGEFCAYFSGDDAMQGWCVPDAVVFPSLLVGLSLLPLAGHPAAEAMLQRLGGFVEYEMERGGVWNHYARRHPWRRLVPPDLDDTACASLLLRARGLDCPRPTNIPLVLATRTRQGLFFTWFSLRLRPNRNPTYWRLVLPELTRPLAAWAFWRGVEAQRRDVDGVVNANVLTYLGPGPHAAPVVAYLNDILARQREGSCDKWYPNPLTVYYFLARTHAAGVPGLEPARALALARIQAARQPDGQIGHSVLDTAWAVCAWLRFGAPAADVGSAVRFLLARQQASGAWPRWRWYYGGPKRLTGWGSEELSTATCLEALALYQQAG